MQFFKPTILKVLAAIILSLFFFLFVLPLAVDNRCPIVGTGGCVGKFISLWQYFLDKQNSHGAISLTENERHGYYIPYSPFALFITYLVALMASYLLSYVAVILSGLLRTRKLKKQK